MKKFNEFINESVDRKHHNKVTLLIEYKMMNKDWSAWTEDSYASELAGLTDDEILDFMNKSEDEIDEIESEIEYILKNIYDNIFEPEPKSISEVRLEKLNKIFGKKLK